jgi:hypothetical protein
MGSLAAVPGNMLIECSERAFCDSSAVSDDALQGFIFLMRRHQCSVIEVFATAANSRAALLHSRTRLNFSSHAPLNSRKHDRQSPTETNYFIGPPGQRCEDKLNRERNRGSKDCYVIRKLLNGSRILWISDSTRARSVTLLRLVFQCHALTDEPLLLVQEFLIRNQALPPHPDQFVGFDSNCLIRLWRNLRCIEICWVTLFHHFYHVPPISFMITDRGAISSRNEANSTWISWNALAPLCFPVKHSGNRGTR